MGSKAKGPNPKDLQGLKKPPLHLVPNSAIAYASLAMADGAGKYNPFNWRDKDVIASIYVAACKRHLDLWWDGQEMASDTGVPNLGAAMACIAILVDAKVSDCLIDDRPIPQDLEAVYEMARPILAGLAEQHAKLPQNRERVWKDESEAVEKALDACPEPVAGGGGGGGSGRLVELEPLERCTEPGHIHNARNPAYCITCAERDRPGQRIRKVFGVPFPPSRLDIPG